MKQSGQASLEAMIAFAGIAMFIALISQGISAFSEKALEARESIEGSATALKCAAILNEMHSTGALLEKESAECVVENGFVKASNGKGNGMRLVGSAKMTESKNGSQIEMEGTIHYE
ncbi:MAG: hypothetical protein WC602_01310 [archaeon]